MQDVPNAAQVGQHSPSPGGLIASSGQPTNVGHSCRMQNIFPESQVHESHGESSGKNASPVLYFLPFLSHSKGKNRKRYYSKDLSYTRYVTFCSDMFLET